MKGCVFEVNLQRQGWQTVLFTILLVLTWGWDISEKRGNVRKRRWNRRLTHLCTLFIGVSRKFHLHLHFALAKILQNGAKLIEKLTAGFKNYVENLSNFRQAVESPKSWNSMGYFCPKITFFQLNHYVQRIYRTLLSTTCLKTHQIPCHFINHKSFYTSLLCFFLAQTLHTFYKSSPTKCKFSDFSLLSLKSTKFLMSFSRTKIQFSFKLWITLQCHET